MPIAWTPPGSQWGLGTVELREQPTKPLTWEQYSLALIGRINRMAAKETPEEAAWWLEEAELQTNLTLPQTQVGDVLVGSGILEGKLGDLTFPVDPKEIRHEPEAQATLDEDKLEDYLSLMLR